MVLTKSHQKEKKMVKRHGKSVKFSVERPEIIHRPVFSIDEKRSCWYSRREYKVITFRRRSSLETLRNAGFDANKVDQEEHCPWGLEQIQSIQHLQHFKARQRAIVQAVLSEQKYQTIVDRIDPEALRLISTSFSRVSLETALERAMQDANLIEEMGKASLVEEHDCIITGDDLRPEEACSIQSPMDAGIGPVRKRPRIVSLQA